MDIEEDIKKVSERFNNETETIEDILKYCRNFKFTFEKGIKLQLVERKYLDRLIEEYKKLLAEREEDKKKIDKLQVLEDDLKDKRIVYVDTPEFEEKFIPKQKVKDKIEELEKAKNKTNKEHWKYNYTLQIAILKELLEEK